MSQLSTSLFVLLSLDTIYAALPPNIIIILADDLGWNDVSFHGSNQFVTPNIDALAYSGIILQNYYTQPLCTPARAALLTGRHPIHNGMHHNVIYAPQPWGLPLSERIMPQYLQSLGYVTRGIGKWHLGFFKANYTPTRRGFDSFYGCWLGHQDHFSHMGYSSNRGYDLHRDLNISWEGYGRYATDLFTEEAETVIEGHNVNQPLFLFLSHTAPHSPLQAPQEVIEKLNHIKDGKRRIYAAMVSKLDESIGRITQALMNKNMLNNSIILFLTDNGGATNGFDHNVASNWPLRGSKDTLWEGGVRGVGLIWSPLFRSAPRVHHGFISVEDWLPTFLSVADPSKSEDLVTDVSKLDGVSQWQALNKLTDPPYQTLLHNIDPKRRIAALRYGKWKIVIGRTYNGHFDGWHGRQRSENLYDIVKVRKSKVAQAIQYTSSPLPKITSMQDMRTEATISCTPKKKKGTVITTICKPHGVPCLFNIEDDPCETQNVALANPTVVNHMLALLMKYQPIKFNNRPRDPRSFPRHWHRMWTTWQDFL